MRYVNTFESFKQKREEVEVVNEEFLGALLNFFKKMWGDAVEDIKKLGERPTMEQLDKWIEENIFNRNSRTYIFKAVMDDFRKKTEVNVQGCLDLVGNFFDDNSPDGVMSKQGLNPFYDGLLKTFGKNLAPLETIKYYFKSARERAIKDYKIDAAKKNVDINDKTYLPDLKALLKPAGTDGKKCKDITIKWVEGTLIPRLLKYIQEVKPEDVNKYLASKNIKTGSGGYKAGDEIVYLRQGKQKAEWDALTDDQKKALTEKPASDIVNIKKVDKVEGDKFIFTDTTGKEFVKTTADVIMKSEGTKVEGQEDLTNTLKELKGKNADAIQKMDDIAKIFMDPEANKEKIEEIEKIIGGA